MNDLNEELLKKDQVLRARYVRFKAASKVVVGDFPDLPFFDLIPDLPTSNAMSLAVDLLACHHESNSHWC